MQAVEDEQRIVVLNTADGEDCVRRSECGDTKANDVFHEAPEDGATAPAIGSQEAVDRAFPTRR